MGRSVGQRVDRSVGHRAGQRVTARPGMADALPGSTPWSSPKEKPVRVQSAVTLALLVLASVGPVPAELRAQPSDTTAVSTAPLFTSEDAIMGGFFVIGTVAMRPMDRYFADLLQDSSTQANRN